MKNTKEEIQQVWEDREHLPGRWVSTFEKLRDGEGESNTCSVLEIEFDEPLLHCDEEMNEEYRSDGDTTEIEEVLEEEEEGAGSEETEIEDDRSDDTGIEEVLDGASNVTSEEEQLNLGKEDGSECEQVVELESEFISQEESCIKVEGELDRRSTEIPDGGVKMEYRKENDLGKCIDVGEWRQESICDTNIEKNVVEGLEKCDFETERNERDGLKELERNQQGNRVEIEEDLDGEILYMDKCEKNDTEILQILEEDQLISNESDSYTEIEDINEGGSSDSEREWGSEEQVEGPREEQNVRDGRAEKGRLECKQIWEREDLESEQELKKDVCMGLKEYGGGMLAIDGDWTWSDQMLELGNELKELKDEEGFSERIK